MRRPAPNSGRVCVGGLAERCPSRFRIARFQKLRQSRLRGAYNIESLSRGAQSERPGADATNLLALSASYEIGPEIRHWQYAREELSRTRYSKAPWPRNIQTYLYQRRLALCATDAADDGRLPPILGTRRYNGCVAKNTPNNKWGYWVSLPKCHFLNCVT